MTPMYKTVIYQTRRAGRPSPRPGFLLLPVLNMADKVKAMKETV